MTEADLAKTLTRLDKAANETGLSLPGDPAWPIEQCRKNSAERGLRETLVIAYRTGKLIVVDHAQATSPVDDRGTPVGDHQMVEAVARAIAHVLNKDDIPDGGWPGLMKEAAHAAINQIAEGDVVRRAQQRTIDRLHREAEGLRTKLVDALADRQAALTAARAQVEAENQRLREALEHYAKDYDYEDKRSQWDGGAIARQALAAHRGEA